MPLPPDTIARAQQLDALQSRVAIQNLAAIMPGAVPPEGQVASDDDKMAMFLLHALKNEKDRPGRIEFK